MSRESFRTKEKAAQSPNTEIRPEDFKIEIGEGVEVKKLEEILKEVKE